MDESTTNGAGATGNPDEPAPVSALVNTGSVGKGVLIGFLMQLVLVPVIPLALVIAVVQLAYIVPLVLYYKRRSEMATVKGLWIAASIVALLNVSCWGLVFGTL
jgi:hypothetical protein